MLHMPSPMLFGGKALPSYADFQTHIKAKPGIFNRPFGTTLQSGTAKYWTTATTYIGSMGGTPYLAAANPDYTEVSPFIRHALPTQAIFDSQVANGSDLYFEQVSYPAGAVSGLARNGFTSSSQANNGTVLIRCPLVLWFDWATGIPMQYDPSTNTGPSQYSWSA